MQECVAGRAVVHISDDVVSGRHLAQDLQSFSGVRKLLEPNRGPVLEPRVWLTFVQKSDLEPLGIKTQRDLANIQALRVHTVLINQGQEEYPDLIHAPRSRSHSR